jgi:hypothetical protein
MKNRAFHIFALAFFAITLGSTWAHAQIKELPLGRVNLPVKSVTCPSHFNTGTECFSGTVSCPGTLDIGFTYGVVNRGGADGTIVFFNGQYGTTVGFQNDVVAYTPPHHDFQTVQVMWKSAWEDTGNATGTDIKTAACRPATLLDWLLNQKNVYSGGGFCAQGASAGSAALAYSLAEYRAWQYLSHVVLESGPVLSDISVGCNPASKTQTVCPGNSCLTGGQGSWQDSPIYVDGAEGLVSNWTGATGQNKCVAGSKISSAQLAAWKAMSIVDGLTGQSADAVFSYPNTSITGWLCSKPPGCSSAACQNNSAAQGDIFYQTVTTPVSVYRVNSCGGTEGIEAGTVPQVNNEPASQAVVNDMVTHCKLR